MLCQENVAAALLLSVCIVVATTDPVFAHRPPPAFCGSTTWKRRSENRISNGNTMMMRDRSGSFVFKNGDTVKVVEDVYYRIPVTSPPLPKSPTTETNLVHFTGTVIDTWEKCEVDPHCCCAELTDPNLAVRVEFKIDNDAATFRHYFAEEELVKLS